VSFWQNTDSSHMIHSTTLGTSNPQNDIDNTYSKI
jgi:hypothetical protein